MLCSRVDLFSNKGWIWVGKYAKQVTLSVCLSHHPLVGHGKKTGQVLVSLTACFETSRKFLQRLSRHSSSWLFGRG